MWMLFVAGWRPGQEGVMGEKHSTYHPSQPGGLHGPAFIWPGHEPHGWHGVWSFVHDYLHAVASILHKFQFCFWHAILLYFHSSVVHPLIRLFSTSSVADTISPTVAKMYTRIDLISLNNYADSKCFAQQELSYFGLFKNAWFGILYTHPGVFMQLQTRSTLTQDIVKDRWRLQY